MKKLRDYFMTAALGAACVGLGYWAASDNTPPPPAKKQPGAIVAIGGSVDTKGDMTILRRLATEATRHGEDTLPRVLIVTTATGYPEETAQTYTQAFAALGAEHIRAVHVVSRDKANDPAFAQEIANENYNIFFFSGGDQSRLTRSLAGTALLDEIREKWADGKAAIGGTSAGAAVLSSLMVTGGRSEYALQAGEVDSNIGFGLVPDAVIDTHFSERERLHRLFNLIATNPSITGIGLDENTAAIIYGDRLEVLGDGAVIIVDGRFASSNIGEIERGEEINLENVSVHRLEPGTAYDLDDYKVTSPAQPAPN